MRPANSLISDGLLVMGAAAVVLIFSLVLLDLPDAASGLLGLEGLLKEMAMLVAVMMGSGYLTAGHAARSCFRQVRL
jgi:hypothetical protein